MLALRDVQARYGAVHAVQGATLNVSQGEIVGVVGHNGAGKSTTLKVIAGVLPATAGTVELAPDVARGDDGRGGVAYVPEDRRIFHSLSVEENLLLGATRRRDRDAIAEDLARELERFPVLERYRAKAAGTLSGGEQQMLAISRALIARPKLLLLDEPTLGLAPIIIDGIFTIVAGLPAEGVTVLLVEQNVVRTIETADRTYVMGPGGRVEREGAGRALMDDPTFRDEYLRANRPEGGPA
jgi:branched-chain amino acid transport system ATP-binding protein